MVGQTHANVSLPPSSLMSPSVRWVACTTVVRGPSTPASYSTAAGVPPVRGQTGVVLGDLLGQVDVQRRTVPRATSTTAPIWSGGTARTEWIAAPTLAAGPSIPRASVPSRPTRSAHACAVPSPNRSCGPASGSGRPARSRPPDR